MIVCQIAVLLVPSVRRLQAGPLTEPTPTPLPRPIEAGD